MSVYLIPCPGCGHEFKFLEMPQDEAIIDCYICRRSFLVNINLEHSTQLISKAAMREIEENVVVTESPDDFEYMPPIDFYEQGLSGLSYSNPLFLKDDRFIRA